ncbi:hypothetical protein TrRE_jg4174 [Triparma retinervis]|uniref:WW domain-containing protein n=1 Tax=Triparma retinervis TaxID=2557542 RepID=A0A9W7DNJ2_9STRA|nr:hypothetical protein TrRE_jg4174 [Triparma retinervis]
MDPGTKTFKQSPPKAKPAPVYNNRVEPNLSIIQLKGMLEAMGLSASTPGARGDQRHAVLLKRLSDVYDDEDASNSDLSDEDDYPPNDSIAPPSNDDEPYIKRRYFPSKDRDFGFDKPKSKSKSKSKSTAMGRKKKEEQPEPRDWASTASYNDDYDVISHTSRSSMQSEDEEEEEEEEEEEDEKETETFDKNNKYGGFDKYGAAYRNRQYEKSNPPPSEPPKEKTPGQPSAFDYLDAVTSQFNLNPTPILRPTTSERDRNSRPRTSERVKFNEPMEPFVAPNMRQADERPRATLHQHQANERIRQSQRRQKERDKEKEKEREMEKDSDERRQRQAEKMERLKAKLSGAAPPKSPKPKSQQGTRAAKGVEAPRAFPAGPKQELGMGETQTKHEKRVARLKAKIKACQQERSTSIQSRLDSRSPMTDEDVKWADKRVSQHEVECARIKIICNRAKSSLVSSMLVDNGKLRMPAQNLLKTLSQRLTEAKRDLAAEKERVREEEFGSDSHGKRVEEGLQMKLRRIEAAGVGIGYRSEDDEDDDEDDDDEEDDNDDIEEARRRRSSEKHVDVSPVTVKAAQSNSPDNALVLPQSRGGVRLPKSDELQELPPSTTATPRSPKVAPPVASAAPPQISESDRLSCEGLRLQVVDPDKACKMYEKSLALEPEGIRTLCNFGLFCYKKLKKMDDAEALFKRGVVVADLIAYDLEDAEEEGRREEHFKKNRVKINAAASLLSNYGNFLKSVRGFASESENMHIKAIALSPRHAGVLGNYAKFKMDARHDFIGAEELFQRALEANPEHSGNMTSYARMLKKMGRFEQAEGIYKRAMEVDPDNVIMLCNYANFQKKVRGDMEKAKELYEMGLRKNPDAQYLQKNWGIFMRDYEKGLTRTGSFKMAKKREVEEARKRKEEEGRKKAEVEKKRKEVEAAKKLLRGESLEEGGGKGGGAEGEEEEEEEEEDDDDFFVSEKLPAHLLTQKRDPSQLPLAVGGAGWLMYKHPSYGIYYHNELTGNSTYDKPEEWEENKHGFAKRRTGEGGKVMEEEEEEKEQVGGDEGNVNAQFNGLFNQGNGVGEEERGEGGEGKWGRLTDQDTKMQYFYNSTTGESRYERPDSYSTAEDAFKVARGGGTEEDEELDILSSQRSEHKKVETVTDKKGGAWGRYLDPETKVQYFFNEETGESQYERPEGFETGRDAFKEARAAALEDKPPVDILSSMRSTHEVEETLGGDWVKYVDLEHGAYYFNSRTEESTYDRPVGMETSRNPFGVMEDGGVRLVPKPKDADILSSRRSKVEEPMEVGNMGWGRYKDEETGYDYYYNCKTEESTYDRPVGFETLRGMEGGELQVKPDADILSSRRSAMEEPTEVLNGGWEKYQDSESGYDYWWNADTDESTYDRPVGFETVRGNPFSSVKGNLFGGGTGGEERESADILSSRREADAVVEEFLNGGWVKYTDDATGHEYYWNESSQESTYERPDGFQTHQNPFGGAR